MFDNKLHSFCSEFYSIEKSIEVVVSRRGEPTKVRLEVLRDEDRGSYCVHAYIQKEVSLAPTNQKQQDEFFVWVSWVDFPWIDMPTVDIALSQALGFLEERCDSPTGVS